MKTTKHLAALVFAAMVVSAFGGPPTDQGFWTFFKEGVKDDLTLVGLGMRAGLRVFVPGWAVVDDIIRGDDPLEDLAELSYDASGEVVDFLRTSEGRKTVARFAQVPKKGEGMKYVTKKSKDLFKAAKWIGWVGTGVDSFIELADAKETADKYLAAREKEYERMRRTNAAKKAADESRRTTPDFSTLEGLVDRQVAYVRGLLAAGRKATRAQFDEFNSLSDQYGKEFDRLRDEILAMTDEARKRECLQRLMAINARISKELDPLLDQAERKRLFKNLSSGTAAPAPAPQPQPKPAPKPKPAQQEHPCGPCWAGDLYGTCSDPNCPNYGNPHRQYKGGGIPNFGRGR